MGNVAMAQGRRPGKGQRRLRGSAMSSSPLYTPVMQCGSREACEASPLHAQIKDDDCSGAWAMAVLVARVVACVSSRVVFAVK